MMPYAVVHISWCIMVHMGMVHMLWCICDVAYGMVHMG